MSDIKQLTPVFGLENIVRIGSDINLIIESAISKSSSDIHIIGSKSGATIIFRIDGDLHKQNLINKKEFLEMLARIKIMARLKLDEHFMPQDGRCSYGECVDIRVSIIPTNFVASVVLRLIYRDDKKDTQLSELGFSKEHQTILNQICKRRSGLILVTGPTGSGKTTTLNALLHTLNNHTQSLVTIEDPIEYELSQSSQIQINERIGLTFPTALRSVLRQDPDVIAVGEIRDEITAQIACHAALTGHTVFSTLHTTRAIQTIVRLKEMGIKPYVIASALLCVISQRLFHKVCEKCTDKLPSKEHEDCFYCAGRGVKGRIVVAEVLEISDQIKNLIRENASEQALLDCAIKNGFISIESDGYQKASKNIIPNFEFENI